MPEKFWNWYTDKNYHRVLSIETICENPVFLIGIMIEYLEENSTIPKSINHFENKDDYFEYLKLGVGWA